MINLSYINLFRTIGGFLQYKRQYLQSILLVSLFCLTTSSFAQLCVFPDIKEKCNIDDEPECALDFETDDPDEDGQTSDVILEQRRARAQAEGAVANTRRAFAEVGLRFKLATDLAAKINIEGHYNGLIKGGALEAFGSFRVSVILRNLDTNEVLINKELDDGTQQSGVASAVSGTVTDEILRDLSKGINYALSLQIRAAARGHNLGESDFKSGIRGLYLDKISIKGTHATDSDGDGLPNEWEEQGIRDCDNNLILNLPAMGADPNHKDLFVELDWVEGSPPSKHTISAVKSAFLAAPKNAGGQNNPNDELGIRLHIDTGELVDSFLPEDSLDIFNTCNDGIDNGDGDGADANDKDCRIGDNLGGGEPIKLNKIPNGASVPGVGSDTDGDGLSDFLELKQQFFDSNRKYAFRYGIVTPKTDIDCPDDPLDDAEDPAKCFQLGGQAKGVNFVIVNDAPSTLMHEIGHTLDLGHGGPQFSDNETEESDETDQADINCKPNYISIMSYALNGGLKQNSQTGQDLDGNGRLDGEIIDFSPPRFLKSNDTSGIDIARGTAPLPTLDESCLDETQILDPSDPENTIAFTDATDSDKDEVPVNAPINWDGDTNTTKTCVPANVNLANSLRCKQDPDHNALPANQELQGADDWSNIILNPRKRGKGSDSELEIIEPTLAEITAIRLERDRADLSITVNIEPKPAIAGQAITFTLVAKNHGPKHVTSIEITDRLPSEIEVLSMDPDCSEMPENTVTCLFGNFHSGDEKTFTIKGRVRADLDCNDQQFLQLFNIAEITNVRGLDPKPANNHRRTPFDVLCIRYEYPAKSVCGTQIDQSRLHLLAGRYGTTVNIHNPNDEKVHFFAKFAPAASPSLAPTPVRTAPLGLFSLEYDQSLAIDCEQIRTQLFEGELPGGLVDGYIVVQSTRKLDMDAVYTNKSAQTATGPGSTSNNIDVENIRGRDRHKIRRALADLKPQEVTCVAPAPGQGNFPKQAKIKIENTGDGDSEPFEISVRFNDLSIMSLAQPRLESGKNVSLAFPVPEQCRPSCNMNIIIDSKGQIDESNEHNNQINKTCLPLPG